jgi:hypothetical protein
MYDYGCMYDYHYDSVFLHYSTCILIAEEEHGHGHAHAHAHVHAHAHAPCRIKSNKRA